MATGDSTAATSGGADYVPRKTSTRLIAIIAALLVVTNVITAVGVYYGTVPAKTAETITVIGPWTGSEYAKFLPVLDAFTNATGIRVSYSSARQEDLQLILPVQFAAHRAPGDVVFMVSSFIKTQGPSGTVLDLTNVVDKSAYAGGALDPVTGTNGKIYGAAYTGKVKPGFWYRQSFFTAHSLTPPTTWAQFQTLLSAIKSIPGIVNPIVSGDGVGWPLSDVVEHFIATFGGASMHRNLTAGTQKWNSTAVHDLFANRIVPLLAAGDFSQPLTWDSTAINGWWNNQYALYFMGSWITGMNPPVTDPNDVGVFSLPAQSGITPGIVFGPDFMFIPAYSTKIDAAKQLLRFLASKDGQTVQVKQGGHLATVLGVPASAYPAIDAKVAQTLVGKDVLPDLDDTKGNPFQNNFWSQLKGLWTSPNPAADLNSILDAIQSKA